MKANTTSILLSGEANFPVVSAIADVCIGGKIGRGRHIVHIDSTKEMYLRCVFHYTYTEFPTLSNKKFKAERVTLIRFHLLRERH